MKIPKLYSPDHEDSKSNTLRTLLSTNMDFDSNVKFMSFLVKNPFFKLLKFHRKFETFNFFVCLIDLTVFLVGSELC